MSYKIVQQESWVGSHGQPKVKQLLPVPESWVAGDVLYWPPNGTKQSCIKKLLSNPSSKPGNDWEQQYAVLKRSKIPDEKTAKNIIKRMQCKFHDKIYIY